MRPGHDARFAIWVWSTHAASKSVTIHLELGSVRHVGEPHFTVCPSVGASSCTVGTLPTGQADELQATVWVRHAAVNDEQIELTASAAGKSARGYSAAGSMYVTERSTPPTTTTTTPPPTTSTIPPVTVAPYPGATGTGTGGLFPTVSPSTSTGIGFPSAKKPGTRTRAVAASTIVPLDPRLIGGQLAGLAVLFSAITIAIARLSLRKPKPQDGPDGDSSK